MTLHPADAPNTLRHPISAPRLGARADAPAAPAPPDADDAPAPPAPPLPSPTGHATSAGTPNVGGGGAPPGATQNTAGPSDGASTAAHSFPPNATPLPPRVADLAQDYISSPQVLRDRDHGIKFLNHPRKVKTPTFAVGTVRRRLPASTSTLAVPLPTGVMISSTSTPLSPTLTCIVVPANFSLYAFYPKTRFSQCSPLVLLRLR